MYAINNDIKPTQDQRRNFILKYLTKFTEAMKQMSHIRSKVDTLRPHDLMFEIIKTFGIKDYYTVRTDGAGGRNRYHGSVNLRRD